MGRAREQLQFVELMGGQGVFGKHSLHSQFHDLCRLAFPQIDRGNVTLSARPTGEPHIAFLGHLRGEVRMLFMSHPASGESNFVGVHNNDVVTGINVRRVIGPMFAHQDRCQASRQSANRHSFGIDHKPLGLMVPHGATIRSLQKCSARSNHNFNLNLDVQTQIVNTTLFLGNGKVNELSQTIQLSIR